MARALKQPALWHPQAPPDRDGYNGQEVYSETDSDSESSSSSSSSEEEDEDEDDKKNN